VGATGHPANQLYNDLEQVTQQAYPEIRRLKEQMLAERRGRSAYE